MVERFENLLKVKDYDDFLNIMAYGDMGLENAQTFDLVNEAIGLLDADILLHIGFGSIIRHLEEFQGSIS